MTSQPGRGGALSALNALKFHPHISPLTFLLRLYRFYKRRHRRRRGRTRT